jgi:hypothetical protein
LGLTIRVVNRVDDDPDVTVLNAGGATQVGIESVVSTFLLDGSGTVGWVAYRPDVAIQKLSIPPGEAKKVVAHIGVNGGIAGCADSVPRGPVAMGVLITVAGPDGRRQYATDPVSVYYDGHHWKVTKE